MFVLTKSFEHDSLLVTTAERPPLGKVYWPAVSANSLVTDCQRFLGIDQFGRPNQTKLNAQRNSDCSLRQTEIGSEIRALPKVIEKTEGAQVRRTVFAISLTYEAH